MHEAIQLSLALPLALATSTSAAAQDGGLTFRRIQLHDQYYAESANYGDFNGDGVLDLVSGPFWWAGPDFTLQETIFTPIVFSEFGFSNRFLTFVHDLDSDGWDDVVVVGQPGQPTVWFENPRPGGTTWDEHVLAPNTGMESPTLRQLVAGGMPELVCGDGNRVGYRTPDPADPELPWIFHPVHTLNNPTTNLHGQGVGDVNGDGRNDILLVYGWCEQPASLVGDPDWPLHVHLFGPGPGGGQMFTYDVDDDGDNDVITSINGHGYGLSWFEHVPGVGGSVQFVEHQILPTTPTGAPHDFSQLHGLELGDVDGDGLLDIITGKTYFAHGGIDPGAHDPPVLYWFRLARNGGAATFTPHLIDSTSGIGRQVEAVDMNGDGRVEILIGNKKGVSVFRPHRLVKAPDEGLKDGGTRNL